MLKPEHQFYFVVEYINQQTTINLVPGFRTRMYIESGMLPPHKQLKSLDIVIKQYYNT